MKGDTISPNHEIFVCCRNAETQIIFYVICYNIEKYKLKINMLISCESELDFNDKQYFCMTD